MFHQRCWTKIRELVPELFGISSQGRNDARPPHTRLLDAAIKTESAGGPLLIPPESSAKADYDMGDLDNSMRPFVGFTLT
jgi:hypothetical protein